MGLLSKELFEAVRKEYPDFSTAEVIAFVQVEHLAHIANNIKISKCSEGKCHKGFMGDML